MRVMTQDRIADIVEMRRLHFVEEDAIFEFARVSHDHAIAHNDVLAHVTTAANFAIFADPRRPFYDRALLDNRSATDEDRVADERFPHQLAQYAWLQAELQITRDLFKRVPNIILVLKQLRMGRVFKIKIFSRRKHLLRTKHQRVA